MRLLKLANWLSEGDLDKYKQQVQQAQQAEAKLKKAESTIENLRTDLEKSQQELAQTQALLQINQGFQVELGETQLKLQKNSAEAQRYKKELFEQQKAFNLLQSQFKQAQQELTRSQNWLQQIKTPIKVVDIQKNLPKNNFDTLWGFGILTPKIDSMANAGSIMVKGWVLGKQSPAKILRVIYQSETLLESPVELRRPVVIQRYPDIPAANQSGFEFSLTVAGLPAPELNLEAVLQDQSVVPLCTIVLKSEPFESESK